MESIKTAILGAGLTGLSAAMHLGRDYHVFEKLHETGGLARSIEIDGFVFDHAPHILYPETEYAGDLIKSLLGDNLHVQARSAWLYHAKHGRYTRFPYQAHLYGLPAEDIIECLEGVVDVLTRTEQPVPKNYHEWIYARFGKGIAEQLMIPYSERVWTIDLREMNFDWIDRRVPLPDFSAILRGALLEQTEGAGFNKVFWYPLEGGIEALPRAFEQRVSNIHCNKTLQAIDPVARHLHFEDGSTVQYDELVYTLPLIHLPRYLPEIPPAVQAAIDGLQFNRIECVNIGINRTDISPYQWCYFYEPEFIFHRISFPRNFSERTCPPGTSSVCCEIASSPHRPLRVQGEQAIIDETIRGLKLAGLLRDDDEILVADVVSVDPAYVIYDLDYNTNVGIIHEWLVGMGIHPCGRFGDWQYYNMDHSIMSGKRVADTLLAARDR